MSNQLDIFDAPPVNNNRELFIAEDHLRIAYIHIGWYEKNPLYNGEDQTHAIAEMNIKIEECINEVLRLKSKLVAPTDSVPVE